ncbi:hypothetical protein CBER1_03449 [Cercospora berteroae]|uniref:F-box domain-containing protein n=1 Tax=Cercospora berteroae TaxID=357750 RepID=A0A2S6CLS2_9PEZI|nr:hypothetical protein CBER1_03449 [Cercospora berteroae]
MNMASFMGNKFIFSKGYAALEHDDEEKYQDVRPENDELLNGPPQTRWARLGGIAKLVFRSPAGRIVALLALLTLSAPLIFKAFSRVLFGGSMDILDEVLARLISQAKHDDIKISQAEDDDINEWMATMAVKRRPPQSPPPVDHLTALPSELLQNIISYLFPTHKPDKVLLRNQPRTTPHDLEHLSNTCRTLHHEVHAWAQHFLLHHQPITKFKPPQNAPPSTKRKKQTSKTPVMSQTNYLRNRNRSSQALLTWSTSKCTFCGKPSSRSAILMNGLNCCSTCDSTHWPDKITKTTALKEYDLKPYHLDTSLAEEWEPAQLIWTWAKKVRYGVYICQGAPTTMFLRKDVEVRAREVHGQDWEEHLARKKEGRVKRREKWAENKKRKLVEEERRLREEERKRGEEAIVVGDLSDEDDEGSFDVETGEAGAKDVIVID